MTADDAPAAPPRSPAAAAGQHVDQLPEPQTAAVEHGSDDPSAEQKAPSSAAAAHDPAAGSRSPAAAINSASIVPAAANEAAEHQTAAVSPGTDHPPAELKSRSPTASAAPTTGEKRKRGSSPPPSTAKHDESSDNPPLPDEAPPLPDEDLPSEGEVTENQGNQDDGWQALFEPAYQAWYYFNSITGATTWENPRVPSSSAVASSPPRKRVAGGYDPRIHGDYDPNADYALAEREEEEARLAAEHERAQAAAFQVANPGQTYEAQGAFNRFTGRFQAADINPENHNDAAKSHRQMNSFFDVDAAANSHDGRSLKAERRGKRISKAEHKAYTDKRKKKQEEKRRAWLRD